MSLDRGRLANVLRAVVLALALPGCLGGQTGQESEAAPECEEHARTVELDRDAGLGFSATDVLTEAGSALHAPARFFQAGITREVTLSLQSASAARHVSPSSDQAWCHERVEIDVQASFATDDGAFDERFSAALHADQVTSWSLHKSLLLAELQGSFDGSEYDLRTWREPRIRIDAELSQGAFKGRISLDGEDPQPGDGVEPTSAYVAEWPAPP